MYGQSPMEIAAKELEKLIEAAKSPLSLIEKVAGEGWTENETVKGNADDIAALKADFAQLEADYEVNAAKVNVENTFSLPQNLPQKTALFGFCPERLSATVLRIFPGYCMDVGNDFSMQSETNIDIDTTINGLNGLDTGSIEAGTAYYPYILKNPVTGVVGAVLSKEISVSLVTRPEGFTLIRKLPWGYVQRPEGIPTFHITAWPLPFTRFTDTDDSPAWAALTDGDSATLSSFSLANFIPDNSRVAYLLCKVTSAGSAGGAWLRSLGSGGNGIPVGYVNGANDISYVYMQIRTTSQLQLSYKVSGGARLSVYVAGYVQTERS